MIMNNYVQSEKLPSHKIIQKKFFHKFQELFLFQVHLASNICQHLIFDNRIDYRSTKCQENFEKYSFENNLARKAGYQQ